MSVFFFFISRTSMLLMAGTLIEKSKKTEQCPGSILTKDFKINCLKDNLTWIIDHIDNTSFLNMSKIP